MSKKIKSFIYLDNYKMYSISSQIFEGLTEYVVKSEAKSFAEKNQQQGSFGSGRIMADIIESNSTNSEKKFLHDYAYTLFEEALIKDKKVIEITSDNIKINIINIEKYNFIKVTNRIVFNDMKLIVETFNKFNKVGAALTYVINKPTHDNEIKLAKEIINDPYQKELHQAAQKKIRDKIDYKQLAIESGLILDENYLKELQYLLDYGYNSKFEVQIPFTLTSEENYLFSGIVIRDFLTEDEDTLIKRYSRETEKEFTMFGILTQTKTVSEKLKFYESISNRLSENVGLRGAIMNIVANLTNLENTFTGKLPFEYIIDPIAIYREI